MTSAATRLRRVFTFPDPVNEVAVRVTAAGVALLALIAVLMVSTVRYPSGKQIDLQTRTKLTTFVILVIVAAAVILFKQVGLLSCALGYIFFGLIRHWRRRHTKTGTRFV